MSRAFYPVVGAIRIEPCLHDAVVLDPQDATLEQLLTSFARQESLDQATSRDLPPIHLVTNRRLHWLPASEADVFIRANLAQLVADLETEWDRLSGVAT
jgi:hypothetical protein